MFLHKQEFILGDKTVIFLKETTGRLYFEISKGDKTLFLLEGADAIAFMKIMRDTKFIFSEDNLGDEELT